MRHPGLTYDANGNMLSDGTNSFTWDARNHLASMNFGANAFQYDPFGRRVGKTSSGATTNFLYDGVNSVQESASGTATANLITGGVDEVFVRTDAAGARNFLTDTLGSTLALADSSGTFQAQYTYEPFGNTTISGSSANPTQYTGRENDGTGLYFYRARYYNPSLQRFISEDPKSFLGGINLFAYALNDPILFSDPLGTDVIVTSYKGGADFGHIGIGVDSCQTSGFYPLDLSIPLGLTGISLNTHYTAPVWAPGVVLPGNGTVLNSVRIPTAPQQDQAVRDFLKNRTADPGSYSGLFGRTCGTFVSDALRAANVPIDPSSFPKVIMRQLVNNPNYSNSGCQ